ncbi:PREDICTED: G-protein coupled receptor 35-like [Chrysochloris asiatica]|uniref:G-protein coupled receptor 35-like n=1 Tax=Chrysochloris asiatica TaxID=185453 RepID=A0A9B0U3H1_CHRAS|nr:PREDICTED: G-protein coupled receptor 35-like [Chrysochloris asiatica]
MSSGASGNCTADRSCVSQVATTVSIILILGLGTLLNGLALWVFGCRLRRWTETRIYMVNLVVADCMLLLSLPGVLYMLIPQSGSEDDTWCRVLQSFYYVNAYMSMSLITAIAVDRYATLCLPMRARAWRCPRQAAITCVVLWLLVTGAVVALASWLPAGESFCFGKGQTRGVRTLVFSLFLFYFLLPVLSFCSVQVLWHLRREWMRAPPQSAASIRKAFCVVAANLATFLLCFLPLHVALLAKLVTQLMDADCPTVKTVIFCVQVTSRMANFNCCLDAFGYYFVASEFQEEVATVVTLPWPFRGWNRGGSQGQTGEEGQAEEGSAQTLQALPCAAQVSPEGSFVPPLLVSQHNTSLWFLEDC